MKKYLVLSTFESLIFTAIFYAFTLLAKIDHYNGKMFTITVAYLFLSIFIVNSLNFWLGDGIDNVTIKSTASSTALLLVVLNMLDWYKVISKSLTGRFSSVVFSLTIIWFIYYAILWTLLFVIDNLYDKYFNEF
mgnify:FL=1